MWIVCYDKNNNRNVIFKSEKYIEALDFYIKRKRIYRINKEIKLYLCEV